MLGVEGHYSRRLQEHLCRLSADASFAAAPEHLEALLGVRVSAETTRQLSHRHGRQMARWQPQDEVGTAAFRTAAGAAEFMVDAGKVHTREEGWKDLKIAVLQKRLPGRAAPVEQWDQHRLPKPTARLAWGAIAPAKQFRRHWRRWTQRAGVPQASELHVLADGAKWIWRSVEQVLTGSQQTLDIYHACQHLAQAGQALYGEETPAAAAFLEQSRGRLLADGWLGICQVVAAEYAHGDTPERRAVLEKLVGYLAPHCHRLPYRDRLAAGQPIGSGTVEGQAKTLGLRLKARGARWKKKHVRGMTALVCVRHSSQWSAYWSQAA